MSKARKQTRTTESKLRALQAALVDGERSGFAEDYSLEALLAETAEPRDRRPGR